MSPPGRPGGNKALPVTDDAMGQIGMSAALAKSYAEDAHGFLGMLAGLLEGVMPEATEVERKPIALFSSKKKVVSLAVSLGDFCYSLHETHHQGKLQAKRAKIVHDVTLKTEEIPVETWLTEIAQKLSEKAKENENTFFALKGFLKQ
ncbi:MAG: hypothetical protein ACYCW6_06905 [Candidatus Xenobia bacterium]